MISIMQKVKILKPGIHFMTILNNLPSIMMPLEGVTFPEIAITLFIHVQENNIF